jgi:hypothetical protein
MPLSKEQWAAAKLALPIFGQMLKDKGCALAETDGNKFRLAEKLAEIPNVPVDPQQIAALLYGIVLADVNNVVNSGAKTGSFLWAVMPKKLSSHLERLGEDAAPKSPRKNAVQDPERTTPLTPAEVEAYVAGIPHFDWRHAAIHNFVAKLSAAGKAREGIFKVVGEFLQIRGRVDALRYLKGYEDAVDHFKSHGLLPSSEDRRTRHQREHV